MRIIVAVLIALPVFAQQTAPPRPPSSPAANIERLEAAIARDPENIAQRGALLSALTASQQPQHRELRRTQILWLIEHHPEAPVLGRREGIVDPKGDPQGATEAARLWRDVVTRPVTPPQGIANAVAFFERVDVAIAREILVAAKSPNAPPVARARGEVLALTVLGVNSIAEFDRAMTSSNALRSSAEAAAARDAIETSNDPNLLGGAGDVMRRVGPTLPRPFNPGVMDNAPDRDECLATAERWISKANQLDPSAQPLIESLIGLYLSHTSGDTPAAEKIAWLRKADALATNDRQRINVLPALALAEFESGDDAAAAKTVERLLAYDPRSALRTYYSHIAHTISGRIAFEKGDIESAKKHLLDSAVLAERGVIVPDINMTLAQDLLDAGERATVLEFLERARGLFRSDNGRIDHLIKVANTKNGNLLTRWFAEGQRLVSRPAPAAKNVSLDPDRVNVLLFRRESCPICDEVAGDIKQRLGPKLSDVNIVAIDVRTNSAAAVAYMVEVEPTSVFIDRQGRVTGYLTGIPNPLSLQREVDAIFNGPPDRSLPAPSTRPAATAPGKVTISWDRVDGAESYLVHWDRKDEKGWESDRGQQLVNILPTRETSVVIDVPSGTLIRWRVVGVGSSAQPAKRSEWQEATAQ